MSKLTLSTLFNLFILCSLSSTLLSPYAQAAEAEFCMSYARDLINKPQTNENAPKSCQGDQPQWNSDKSSHIKWCLENSKSTANKKRYNHNKLVNLCNDTYKLVLLNRNRVATLPLSVDEERALKPASDDLKQAIISGKMHNPYSKLYPAVNQARTKGILKECTFNSLEVNMDMNSESKEWIVAVDDQCLANTSVSKQPHVWLIQQLTPSDANYTVLFEGHNHKLILKYSVNNSYRNISIKTPLTKQEETKTRCGSIIADWSYSKGRYLPLNGKADEEGSCLPEYNLPDYLQGANTFSMAADEWAKGMKSEEEKRIALYAPYKKAMTTYIPQWIKNMEQLVPATDPKIKPSENTHEKKNPIKNINHTLFIETRPDENKSFLQSVRSLLGME